MKAFLLSAAAIAAATLLCGCPVYSDDGNSRVCTTEGCFDCPDQRYSGACGPTHCATAADCSTGYTCGRGNVCVLAGSRDAGASGSACTTPAECPSGWTCGWDYACHPGDCSGEVGCPSRYQCTVSGGHARCSSGIGGDSDSGSRETGAIEAGAPTEAAAGFDASPIDATPPDAQPSVGQPNDAGVDTGADSMVQANDAGLPGTGADAVSTAPTGAPCNADSQCAGAGARCIEGQCTAADHLCTEAIQCPAGSPVCVGGRCASRCTASDPCPTGFACDFTLGTCSVNPSACTCDSQCLGGTKCVESHCVAPCASDDAETACPSGQVCINSGCIPHERVLPSCMN